MGNGYLTNIGHYLRRLRPIVGVVIAGMLLLNVHTALAAEPEMPNAASPDNETATVSVVQPSGKYKKHYAGSGWFEGNTLGGEAFKGYTVIFGLEIPSGNAEQVPSYCTDAWTGISKGAEFTTDPNGVRSCEVTWILENYPTNSFSTHSSKWDVAALQSAIWHFSDGFETTNKKVLKGKVANKDGQKHTYQQILDAMPEDPCAALESTDPTVIHVTPATSQAFLPNTTQTFTVTVSQGGVPLPEQEISLMADMGVLSANSVTTNARGQATFTLSSETEGTATIAAYADYMMPVGTRFVPMPGAEDQQVLVLAKETNVTVRGYAKATWNPAQTLVAHNFHDTNMNGEQDAGEEDLVYGYLGNYENDPDKKWQMALYQEGTSEPIDTKTVNDEANASFEVAPGTYRVEASTEQAGWNDTTPNPSEWVTVEAGGSATVNLGHVRYSSVQAISYRDDNRNGEMDDGEEVLEGTRIELSPGIDGTSQKNTDEEGSVAFVNLVPQTYVLEQTIPDGWSTYGATEEEVELAANEHKVVYFGMVPGQTSTALTVKTWVNQPVVMAEDEITYRSTISNVGSDRAANLEITSLLPDNMTYVEGSTTLNGEAHEDPIENVWTVANLNGEDQLVFEIRATVNSVEDGVSYPYTVKAKGVDSRNAPIPADNSELIPADIDPDDQDMVVVNGPLTWEMDSTFVAYEDLKNVDWSDWDYNDLIMSIEMEKGLNSDNNLTVLKMHYAPKAKSAAYDHNFIHELPIEGPGQYDLTIYDENGDQVSHMRESFADQKHFSIFEHTKDALPQSNADPDQTEFLSGYRADLIVVLYKPELNPNSSIPKLPWNPYLKVYDTGEQVNLPIPGYLDNVQEVNDAFEAVTPLLGYELPFAHVFKSSWLWPYEMVGIWYGYPSYVNYIESGKADSTDWYATANADYLWHNGITAMMGIQAAGHVIQEEPTSAYFASPVAADLDGTGTAIVIGNLLSNQMEVYNADQTMKAGWPQATDGGIKATAAVVDMDNDGDMEILAGDTAGKLYAWHHDGTAVTGWPVQVSADYRVLATPAFGDINNDGTKEVVVPATDGKLYLFNVDGTAMAESPLSIGDEAEQYGNHVINSSPRIADLNGDGYNEIVVGSYDGSIYAFSFAPNGDDDPFRRGDPPAYWSLSTNDVIMSTPAVADIDPTVAGMEVVIGSGNGAVYMLDKHGNELWKNETEWTVRSSPLVADMDGDGDMEVLIGSDDHRVYAYHHDGTAVTGWPRETNANVFASPMMADVNGDGTQDIVVGSDDSYVYVWDANGSTIGKWETSQSVKATPAMLSSETEGDTIVVGDFGGNTLIAMDESTLVSNVSRVFLPHIVR